MPKHHHGAGFGLGALGLGAVATGIAGTYKVGEALVNMRKLYDVGEDNMVFVRITERVRLDLAEADRLMAIDEVKYALSKSPEKVTWIKKTIGLMKMALHEMAQHTVRVNKDVSKGKWVGLRNRIWWLLEEREKLELHTTEVARCHDGLLQVLGFLATLEPLACCEDAKENKQNVSYDYAPGYRPGAAYAAQDNYNYGGANETRYIKEMDVTYQGEPQNYARTGYIGAAAYAQQPRYREDITEDRYLTRGGGRREEHDTYIDQNGDHVVEMDRRVEVDRRTQAPYRGHRESKVRIRGSYISAVLTVVVRHGTPRASR